MSLFRCKEPQRHSAGEDSRTVSSRPDPRSDEPGIARRARTERSLAEGIEPGSARSPSVDRFGWRFQIGDKVIQTENENDYD